MFHTKSKVAAVVAALATVFSALVVASPAQAAAPNKPVISSVTLNGTSLTINVSADGGSTVRDELVYEYKKSTESTSAFTSSTYSDSVDVDADADSYSFTVTTGFEYDVRVLAKTVGDASDWRTASVTVPTAPAAAPTVASQSDGDIDVTWVEANGLSTSGDYLKAEIHVYRNGARYSAADFDADAVDDVSAVFTPPASGYSWSFKVATQNSSGYSDDSPISDQVTYVAGKAGAPEGVTAVTVHGVDFGDGQIRLTWSDPDYLPSGSASRVKIEWKTVDGSWSSTNSYVPSSYPVGRTTIVTSSNLVPGTAYNVRLSVSVDGSSPYTYGSLLTLANTVTPITKPAPASALEATPGDGQVQLTWTAGKTGGSDITNYLVDYRATTTSSWSSATTINTGSATASATVTGLTNGSAYYFRVRAVNVEGADATGIALAEAVTPNPLPGAPVSLVGSAGNSAVTLGWSAPATADLHGQTITDYKVEYKASTSSTWKVFAHTASTIPSSTVTGLANGVAYNFRVSTKTSVGYSTPTVAAATVTPSNSLGSPALGQFAVSLNAGSVSVLDNQITQSSSVITSPLTGAFKVSAATASATFKSLDGLSLGLPLNASSVVRVFAGKKIAVSGTGFKPGSTANLYIVGNNTAIGTGLVSAAGTVKITGKLPATLAVGSLVFQLNGSSALNNLQSISIGATSAGSLLVTSKSFKFAVGSVKLSSTEKHKLRELAKGTTLTPIALRVIGNTYGKATKADKARALSRAKAVAKYLKSQGVNATFNTVTNTGKAKTLSTARNVVVTVDAALN